MTSKPLTAVNIRSARPGDVLRDDTVPGLHLRVFPTKSVYYVYYRTKMVKTNGKPVERRLRLGVATQALTIPESRKLAARALLDVANGIDPVMTKRHRAAIPTLDAHFKACMSGYWSGDRYVKSGYKREVETTYARCIKDRFGDRLMSDSFDDIEEWHEEYGKRETYAPNQGNRALAMLSALFSLAEKSKYGRLRPFNSNPCSSVTRHTEAKRTRFATKSELARIGPLLIKYAATHAKAVATIYLLMFSGSRPSAIIRATHEQLTEISTNGQCWGTLRFRGKTGAETVYLPPQAMTVIRSLPKDKETLLGVTLQPARELWEKLRVEAGCPDLWLRDLRRTFATVGLSNGEAMARISELLNHKTAQTTKVYAKLDDREKIKAAGAIAGRLEEMLKAG